MKKSNFIALILGTASGVLFALGMCMALLPDWNSFTLGIVIGSIGLVLGLITVIAWRRMEHKPKIKLKLRTVLLTLYGILGAAVFGVGMCLCLVAESFISGTAVGLMGILMLISLIPIIKGIK